VNISEALPTIQKELRPYFRSLTRDVDLADDISQFAALKCWQYWQDKDKLTLTRLMTTVGRNCYFTERKRQRNRRNVLARLDIPPQTEGPEAELEKNELLAHIEESVRQLPSHCQEVIQRLFYLGQTYDEAALAMGRSVNTIKTWRTRSLARLRALMSTGTNEKAGTLSMDRRLSTVPYS
jgi:RNA polymerase sigma factor (sigma-70 family)